MSIRNALLNTRRIASGPMRRLQVQRLAARGCAPLYCLFYHRVADTHPNDWTISCDRFAQHIDYMRSQFEMIGLDELQRRVRQKDSHRPAIAITFDDGYAENSRFALPLLMQHKIPCTYFVSTQHVLTGRPFGHDQAAGVPLPVNTVEELRAAAEGGVEIGLHTRTHVDLAGVDDADVLQREITDAVPELADLIGRRIRYFAFPYGLPQQITQAGVQAVYDAGLEGFCSAFGAYNLPGRDAYHIRRIHGDPDFSRLRNWLEFDSRKLKIEPELRYSLPAPPQPIAPK
ncbi:polysaccharide deacetylase family protein [Roseimaritima ulvae]|uniref:Polysaccharide deacetylase n=1 Tax=Roseimaritima ulvae TaxID=980254 RepID=A0A5B9QT48_9BACT|nr:polysaccharide deacetylase family protein [Roseimaritima ulvae]QEG41082.1 Polysaccharide deacetylase [Roseimaritima ulvae]